jgi:SAM-dependent methyltransferase
MTMLVSGAAVQTQDRPVGYYDEARPEVAELVPRSCRRVLEVGCGTGQLGRLLAERGHRVTGLELVEEAAAQARGWLDEVIVGDVEQGMPFPAGSFDAIVFADVLEHLVDPWRIVRESAALLAEGGVVVASIPNVQNLDVIRRLVRGRWDYRERGILDRGHLRFFTLRSVRELFAQAGLEIVHVGYRYRRSRLREVLAWLTWGKARCFWARQYLVVAKRR